MFRYIAFVWRHTDESQCELAARLMTRTRQALPQWRQVFHSSLGCAVFCVGIRPRALEVYQLPHGQGVILGTLFDRARNARVGLKFTESDARDIVDSRGCRLVDSYWGRYVAFLVNTHIDAMVVLRDPTGGLPCWNVTHLGVDIYFSDIDAIDALDTIPLAVDWTAIAAGLVAWNGAKAKSALSQVSEVPAGEATDYCAGACSSRPTWSAVQAASTDTVAHVDTAISEVRRTTLAVLEAWGSCYEHVLLHLSGGFDSSLVLAGLKHGAHAPGVTCLNYYSEGADSDERAYARASARHMHCELIERERNPRVDLADLFNSLGTPAPSPHFFRVEASRFEAELAQRTGATVSVGGAGGDELFYQNRAPLAAADFLFSHGLHPQLFTVALDAARLDGLSVWSVLWGAFRSKWRRGTRLPDRRPAPTLLSADASVRAAAAPTFDSLREDLGAVGPAKAWHITMLQPREAFYDLLGRDGDPDQLRPLLAQPLIELCLRIPVHILVTGGVYRSVARRAFCDLLPATIVRRATKGGVENHLQAMLDFNRPFIRSMLLDGVLRRETLIEVPRVENALARDIESDATKLEILNLLSTEVWLRRWDQGYQTPSDLASLLVHQAQRHYREVIT